MWPVCVVCHSIFHHHALQWRHNEHDGVSTPRRLDCLLNGLFRCRLKKTSKPRVTGLCDGNSPVTGEFPVQRASDAENVSISWRHHGCELGTCHLVGAVLTSYKMSYIKISRSLQGSKLVFGVFKSLINLAGPSKHYCDVKMGAMASQITSLTVLYSTVYSGQDQRKLQSSASLAFVQGIHRWPVNSLRRGPVTRKMFPFDDVIMKECCHTTCHISTRHEQLNTKCRVFKT